MTIKVRIAPSPTGFLHIGTAQSALYNWLFARKSEGSFCLRIEDTDKERSTREYEQSILDALKWLGLEWDGEFVRQSENLSRHSALLEKLLAEGKAFYCHHAKEELEAERKEQEDKKEPPRHICDHKNSEKGKQPGGIIRLAVPEHPVRFKDIIRGPIEFKSELLGDFSIARAIDDPLYNFAVVADDSEMGITHVIRGEDHISNTPKQILIYEALGLPVPQFAHLPLILASDRSKLSKRHGAVAVIDYRKDYLPESILNFLGGLSYTFSKEILSKEEMMAEFELAKVHKSGAVFDQKKLDWINSQYIKNLSPQEFKEAAGMPEIPDAAVPLITERLERLSDAQNFSYLWEKPVYEPKLLIWKNSSAEETKNSLQRSLAVLEASEWGREGIMSGLEGLSAETGNRGLVFWPVRVALSGKDKSPDPVALALVLGKEETLTRLGEALTLLAG
ncbi:MAG TPA: glutamate--tRNA ligase [Candidatus Paceibacterota bacterium]|nr:glutamate--tRNA ligase [Candidatus Paceibacterota bacterium]